MMYVKHFVTCKALCTCVWVTALIMVIILSPWDGISMGPGLGEGAALGTPIGSSQDTGWAGRFFYYCPGDPPRQKPALAWTGIDTERAGSKSYIHYYLLTVCRFLCRVLRVGGNSWAVWR